MNIEVEASAQRVAIEAPTIGAKVQSRLAGLAVLGGAGLVFGWLVLLAAQALTDAWVAPISLSPDNDAVIQMRLSLNRQLAELARAEAEILRVDADIEAVDTASARLSALKHSARQTLSWQAGVSVEERRAVERGVEHLRTQQGILERLRERQGKLTAKAKEDLAAGLVDRTEVEKAEQALDTLEVSLVDNRRLLDEAQVRLAQIATDSQAYRTAFAGRDSRTRKPEVAAGEEHEARVALELVRLEAEKRGLVETRRVAAEMVAKQREILEEAKTRPLYRAMTESTDVAFVPYSQLKGVDRGARVLACTWALFNCRDVGAVSEVLRGEVVTQDPWGETARGQYALLELTETEAIREKVLRIRRL